MKLYDDFLKNLSIESMWSSKNMWKKIKILWNNLINAKKFKYINHNYFVECKEIQKEYIKSITHKNMNEIIKKKLK